MRTERPVMSRLRRKWPRASRGLPYGVLLALSPALRAAEGGGEQGGGNPLTEFSPGLLIWTVLTFLVLLALLRWKAWPPIVRALQVREESVRGAIARARQEREEAEKLLEQHRALIAEARRQAAAIIEQARHDAERLRQEILDRARKEQQEILEGARRQIEYDTRAAVEKIQTMAVDLALAVSERLLKQSLDGDAHRRLVEETLREVSRQASQAGLIDR